MGVVITNSNLLKRFFLSSLFMIERASVHERYPNFGANASRVSQYWWLSMVKRISIESDWLRGRVERMETAAFQRSCVAWAL